MFFRWIQLREARAQNARLPILAASRDLLLLHAVLNGPNFGPIVIWRIADEHHFEERLIGQEIDLVMELRGKRTQFLENRHADGLKIRLCLSSIILIFGIPPVNALKV